MKQKPETYSTDQIPKEKDPKGDGWSKDIILVLGEKELRGYYDPQGSVAGGKFFYYKNGKDGKAEDCAKLEQFPSHWYYAEVV